MKKTKYWLHYFFGKHKWVFMAKAYKGNAETGHKEDCYYFKCKTCHKTKKVKVVE